MSSALAIAAVTASLKDRLNNGLLDQDLSHVGSFSVTAQPPDQISKGTAESNQLNLFLYQVTPNLGWRNADLPSRDNGGSRVTNPPLALDLHYLLTAYGAAEMNAEILLGYGMQLMHEFPGLSRQQLRTALGNPAPPIDGALLPGPFGTMSAVDLADQIELIKISPQYLSADDLSKLWTAMQARYRPSMAYLVSVVLIQGVGPMKASLPVLKRGPDDRGPTAVGAPFPTLAGVRPDSPVELPAMRLGDAVTLTGTNLGGLAGTKVIFENSKAGLISELDSSATTPTGGLTARVPSDAAALSRWAVGIYIVSLRVSVPNQASWLTNSVPIALAPKITNAPANAKVGQKITINCAPRILPQQKGNTFVIFGSQLVAPTKVDTPNTNPGDELNETIVSVTVPDLFPDAVSGTATVVLRLRVDGIDSLPFEITGSPPTIAFNQKMTVDKP